MNGELGNGTPRNKNVPTYSELQQKNPTKPDPWSGVYCDEYDNRINAALKTSVVSNSTPNCLETAEVFDTAGMARRRGQPRMRIASDSAVGKEELDFSQLPYYDCRRSNHECDQCATHSPRFPPNCSSENPSESKKKHDEFIQNVKQWYHSVTSSTSGSECAKIPTARGYPTERTYDEPGNFSKNPIKLSPRLSQKIDRFVQAREQALLQRNSQIANSRRFPMDGKFPEVGDTPEMKRPNKRSGKDRVRFMDMNNKEIDIGEVSPRPYGFRSTTPKQSPKPESKFSNDLKEIHV